MAKRRPAQGRSKGYRRILWPTDFSPVAKRALPHALRLGADGEAELVILHVFTPPAIYVPEPVPAATWATLDKEARQAAHGQLREVTAEVKAKAGTLRVRAVLTQGSPFVQIPRVAKRLGCDLIVLATHGRTGLRHILLGSVAENVVRSAPCPVLTVRPVVRTQ